MALLAPALLAALAIVLTIRPLDDFDFWYHLAAGREMWATGHWPTTNVFAFTAGDGPDVDLYWLYQLVLYGAYAAGGYDGCVLLAVGLVLGTTTVLYATARRHAPPAIAATLLALALTIASSRLVPRPELVGFFLLALFLYVLDDYPRSGRAVLALVPLQILWANTHGTVPTGIAVAGCYWLGATLAFLPLPRGWRLASGCTAAEWRRLTLVALLLPVSGLVNPWGVAGARLPLDLLAVASGGSVLAPIISELQPPFVVGLRVIAYAWVALLGLTALSFGLNPRRWHLGGLLAVASLAALSARAFRAVAPFAWVAIPTIARNLGQPLAHREGASRLAARARSLIEAGAMLAIATLVMLVVTNRFSRFAELGSQFRFGVSRLRVPVEAVDFALEVGMGSRPFDTFETGGYLAWRLYPSQRIFIDGRAPAYPESHWRKYLHAVEDPETWPRLAEEYRLDWAFLYHRYPTFHPLARYLAVGHGWTMVYYDELASLYVPTDEAHRELRERAARAFAGRLAERRSTHARASGDSLWRRIAVQVEEPQRLSVYGDFLRAMGWYGEAMAAYEQALSLDPDLIWKRYELGVLAWFTGDPGRAAREWRDVLRRDPRFAPARQALELAAARGVAPSP